MSVLALAFQGPFATYAHSTHERFRHTNHFPTKSAVCGLIGAALGRDRLDDQSDLYALKVHVREDQPGVIAEDFQTIGQSVGANGKRSKNRLIVERGLINDAAHLVVIEGPRALLDAVAQAVLNPTYPLYLGTAASLPSRPVYTGPPTDDSVMDILSSAPLLGGSGTYRTAYLEDPDGTFTINDQPTAHRHFRRRYIRMVAVPVHTIRGRL